MHRTRVRHIYYAHIHKLSLFSTLAITSECEDE